MNNTNNAYNFIEQVNSDVATIVSKLQTLKVAMLMHIVLECNRNEDGKVTMTDKAYLLFLVRLIIEPLIKVGDFLNNLETFL